MKVRSRSLIYEAIQFTKEVEASMPLPKGVYRDHVMKKRFDPDNDPEVCFINIFSWGGTCKLQIGDWIIYDKGDPIDIISSEKLFKEKYAPADEIDEKKVVEALAVDFYMIAHPDLLWNDATAEVQKRYKEAARQATEIATQLLLNRIDSIDEEMMKNIPHLEKLAVAVGDLQSYLRKNGESISIPLRAAIHFQKIAVAYGPLHSRYSQIVLEYLESSKEKKS